MMRYTNALVLLTSLLLAPGCRDTAVGDDDAAAVADAQPIALALADESATVAELLARLEAEVRAAIEADLYGDVGRARFLRAEALSDRLLAAKVRDEWLEAGSGGYFLGARLRQIQAQTDRVVVELRRGLPGDVALQDARALVEQINALLLALERSGSGEAPPPLDSLLAQDTIEFVPVEPAAGTDTAAADAEEEDAEEDEGGGGLLGDPVDDGGR